MSLLSSSLVLLLLLRALSCKCWCCFFVVIWHRAWRSPDGQAHGSGPARQTKSNKNMFIFVFVAQKHWFLQQVEGFPSTKHMFLPVWVLNQGYLQCLAFFRPPLAQMHNTLILQCFACDLFASVLLFLNLLGATFFMLNNRDLSFRVFRCRRASSHW